ncbi:MAG TPA: DUF368 domain-containing protein [Candidatus Omnitrophota bacterium]|nr:DUF368 domain-containing protein [Candidatus Omnitrophota bacterium]HPN88645.1 DUF368 domain-containing protein [Candidatus Omnitrophota bacterium]
MQSKTQKKGCSIGSQRNFSDYAILSLKGFCMGIADVIPGISGGTIAFILGIYEELIGAIRSFDSVFLKLVLQGKFQKAFCGVAWRFLFALLLGIAAAILLFSRMISWLLRDYPVLINAFFFGLILATIPIIVKIIKQWNKEKIVGLILSTVGTFYFVQMVPMATPETGWFVFLSGALAICAMILPGISGAFILLLLGKYQFILNAIHARDILTLIIFCLGIVFGILSFVRVLEWLFKRFHDMTIAILSGFVIGSLNKIWPWKNVLEFLTTDSGKIIVIKEVNILPSSFDGQFFFAFFLILLGYGTSFILHRFGRKDNGIQE